MSYSALLATKQKLKDYKIKQQIGTGAYGKVFKVEKNNNIYVLKQIPLNHTTNIETIINEAKILSSLNSEYVVKYYDSFIEENNLNIIMEYCENGDLSTYMKEYKEKTLSNKSIFSNYESLSLPDDIIWKMFIQISLGLYDIHKKKILHRDLKTLNIFLTKDYKCKIGDLGVAKILNGTNYAKTFVGTPYYLSPEICDEKPYNEKSDVWALGCILYEMASFKHPFNATNTPSLYIKIMKGKYEPLSLKCSFDIKKMVDILLEKNFYIRPNIKDVICMDIFIDNAKKYGLYDKISSIVEKKKNKQIFLRNLNMNKGFKKNINMNKNKKNSSNKNNNIIKNNSNSNIQNNNHNYNLNINNINNNINNYRESKGPTYLKYSPSKENNKMKKKEIIFKPDLNYEMLNNYKIINENKRKNSKKNLTPNKNFSPKTSNSNILNTSPNKKKNNNNFDIINPEEFLLKLQNKTSNTLQNISVVDFLDEKINHNDKFYDKKEQKKNSNDDDEVIDNTFDNYCDLSYDKSNITNEDTDDKTMSKDEIVKNERLNDIEKYKKKYYYYLEELKKYQKEINIDKIFEMYVEIQNDNDNIDNVINSISNYLRIVIPLKENHFIDLLINLYKYENLWHDAEKGENQ